MLGASAVRPLATIACRPERARSGSSPVGEPVRTPARPRLASRRGLWHPVCPCSSPPRQGQNAREQHLRRAARPHPHSTPPPPARHPTNPPHRLPCPPPHQTP